VIDTEDELEKRIGTPGERREKKESGRFGREQRSEMGKERGEKHMLKGHTDSSREKTY